MQRFIPIVVALAASGCATDPYLTCGVTCADGSTPPGDGSMMMVDGMQPPDSSPTDTGMGGMDTSFDGNCRQNGYDCNSNGACCSNACSSSQKCTTSCQPQGQSCMSQPDNCCIGFYCNGTCVQCLALDQSCSYGVQCCSGRCSQNDAGQKVCVPD